MKYDPKALEAKWQARWESAELYKTPSSPKREYYVLEMFAYPSGDIHMGHFRNYGIGDALARYRMMRGYDVLHPFGWDAFGLPAENAAIKNKLHPRDWTLKNVETGKATLKRMGISYDWDREVRTFEPDYYKWTQWLFLLFFKNGWAYRSASTVNWCETGRHPRQRTGARWTLLALQIGGHQEADREHLVLQVLGDGRAAARRH